MSVVAFISSQRTDHDVPHALTYRALGLSESWFYKWRGRRPTIRAPVTSMMTWRRQGQRR